MATAELAEHEIATPNSGAAWWRRWHTYAFAAVIGHQIGVGPFLAWIFDGLNSTGEPEVIVGVAVAQCFLLGLWAALGGLRVLPRWGAVGLAFIVGTVALIRSLPDLAPEEFWENLLMCGLLGMTFVTACAVGLLPLRSLVGWRIDFDAAYHRDARLRRGQVAFLDFAGYTCAVAGLLTVVRMMLESSGDESSDGITWLAAVVAFVVATAAIPAYIALTWKWLWAAMISSGLWAIAVLHVQSRLAQVYSEFQFFGSGSPVGPTQIELGLAAFHGSIAATVVITLVILRLCGLKLLVVQQPAT